LIIFAERIEEYLGNYKSWKNVIFNTYHQYLIEGIEATNPIGFKSMNKPLSIRSKNKSKYYIDSEIKICHQDVTYESYKSLAVILKQLKNINKIKLNRSLIERWIMSDFGHYFYLNIMYLFNKQ
jgi:CRP/FNR family transcriptional regulator